MTYGKGETNNIALEKRLDKDKDSVGRLTASEEGIYHLLQNDLIPCVDGQLNTIDRISQDRGKGGH
jgi:hypothetical protein